MTKTQDPRWQRRRMEILNRDDFTCVACKAKDKPLHVHHKRYSGELWESPDEDLQTLCEDCHQALGIHPKAGVWWEPQLPNRSPTVLFAFSHCPCCGSEKVQKKERHTIFDSGMATFDVCEDCDRNIGSSWWPDGGGYLNKAMVAAFTEALRLHHERKKETA